MNNWQRIETAPRDGTIIDAWQEQIDLKRAVTGQRKTDIWWMPDEKGSVSFVGGKWMTRFNFDTYAAEDENTRITHWMPLPSAPKQGETE